LKEPERSVDARDRVRRFFERVDFGAVVPYLLVGLLLVAAVVVLGRDIEHHLNAMERWVEDQGAWGPVVFGGVFIVVTSMLFPESVLSMVAGALFGLTQGLATVVAASLVAAALQYGLARRLLRGRIQKILAKRPSLAALQRAALQDEVRLQALLRLTPLNPASLSYTMGAAGVRFSGFMLACAAFVPNLVLEVYFGYAGKHVARIAGRSARGVILHDIVVFAGLAACVVVMVSVSRMARKAVTEAVGEVP
jgi:uncharacterized membrane protein YdjX (TVP38/TMEM64 family)